MTRTATFRGFPKSAHAFLEGLRKNNRREWFQARKETFEGDVRAPMAAFVEAINEELREFAPEYVTPAKASMFRIHRDVRFSKDKSPYKTEMAAHFPFHGRAPDEVAGFYVALTGKDVALGGGTYVPGSPALSRLRDHVAEHGDEFRALAGSKAIRKSWGAIETAPLKGMPRGWKADHPEADLLRMTRAFFWARLPPTVATSPRLVPETIERFRVLLPCVRHLDAVMGGR